VTVQAGCEGADALLRVVDDGPGMPAADRARAGERFLRVLRPAEASARLPSTPTSAVAQGSGLGLAIASAIVQRHRGALELGAAREHPSRPGLVATLRWPVQAPA
jgi:two-component system sensor histidine kinase TctE